MENRFSKIAGNESPEHLGEDLGRSNAGELILRSQEFGKRLDAQGEERAQEAIRHAVAPKVTLDKNIW